MNLIPFITSAHPFYAKSGLPALIYFFLISTTSSLRGNSDIWSQHEYIDVLNKFKLYDESEVEAAYNELKDSDLVKENGNGVVVGERVDGTTRLFSKIATLNTEAEEEQLLQLADAFIKNTKGGSQSRAKALHTNLLALLVKRSGWKVYDFMNFFKYVHEVYFQDFHREFTQKEAGQMKNLVALYDQITLMKMVVFYILHNEQFGRSSPTIASLVYNKDDIQMKIRGGSQRSQSARTTNISQDF